MMKGILEIKHNDDLLAPMHLLSLSQPSFINIFHFKLIPVWGLVISIDSLKPLTSCFFEALFFCNFAIIFFLFNRAQKRLDQHYTRGTRQIEVNYLHLLQGTTYTKETTHKIALKYRVCLDSMLRR